MAVGRIYILINSAMQGLLKIGRTERSSEERAAELSKHTGVPADFCVAYEEFVADCDKVEKLIHERLDPFRLNNNREFFKVELKHAIRIVSDIARDFAVSEQHDAESRQAMSDVEADDATAHIVNQEFKRVERFCIICQHCSQEYLVTMIRHEDKSCCPNCKKDNPVECWWEKSLNRITRA
jgi:hypothetical protein